MLAVADVAVAALALVGVLAGAAGAYTATRRINSGNVGTSNADALWKAETSLREALAARVTLLEDRLETSEARLDVAEADLLVARTDLKNAQETLAVVRGRLDQALRR